MTVKDSSRKLKLWVRNRSDLELSRKWDWCLADAVVKRGTGLGLGHVFSLTFFERKMWPLAFVFFGFVNHCATTGTPAFGFGMGLGMAHSNRHHAFQVPYLYTENKSKSRSSDSPLRTSGWKGKRNHVYSSGILKFAGIS
uniref:MICOS complex subunit MIC10 n=2 Tax=Sus scrofa TaxID=9823 RepID=A0A4X1UKL1_PIG